MPPKAFDETKRFDRNNRFRGHGPPANAWSITTAGGAATGDIQGAPPLVRTPRGQAAAGHRPERRPCPRKRLMKRSASTGTVAFAAMGRSCKSVVHHHRGWRSNGGYTRGSPLVRTPRGQAAAGHRPERRPCPRKRLMKRSASTGTVAFAAMGRSYKCVVHHHRGWRSNGGYTRGSPLVRAPRGQAAAGHRPERGSWAAPTTARPIPTTSGASMVVLRNRCPTPAPPPTARA
jgi:hypothetical protein